MAFIEHHAPVIVHVGLLSIGELVGREHTLTDLGALNSLKYSQGGAVGVVAKGNVVLRMDKERNQGLVGLNLKDG